MADIYAREDAIISALASDDFDAAFYMLSFYDNDY